jgi:hypothetical protein
MTDTWSETYRHQCEVRTIIAKRVAKGRSWAAEYLDKVEKARGKQARSRLESDILQQWNLGNRGEANIWLVPPVA